MATWSSEKNRDWVDPTTIGESASHRHLLLALWYHLCCRLGFGWLWRLFSLCFLCWGGVVLVHRFSSLFLCVPAMILPAGTSERFALTLLFACFGPSDSMEHLPQLATNRCDRGTILWSRGTILSTKESVLFLRGSFTWNNACTRVTIRWGTILAIVRWPCKFADGVPQVKVLKAARYFYEKNRKLSVSRIVELNWC